jgi:guanylate kinase
MFAPLVLVGPSGVGKDTLRALLLQDDPTMQAVMGWTSRAPRLGEVNGVDYNFSSKEEMCAKRERGEFAEHVELYGNIYGMTTQSIKDIVDAGRRPVMVLNVHGLDCMRVLFPDLVAVYIAPPSDEELTRRLTKRGCANAADLEHRLECAKTEMAHFSTPGVVHFTVVNDDMDRAADELRRKIRL